MINSIKIINFRNFLKKEFYFDKDKNYIVGENGKGKTNVLEAISTITYNSIIGLSFEDLVKKGENLFFIEIDSNNNKIGLSFDLETKKKKFLINTKSVTKKKFRENIPKSVFFAPITMNMFYLGPTLRREFLDNILLNCFDEYEKILKNYKKIITNRNKVLKNIYDKKSNLDEINFWNEVFIKEAIKIYEYRFKVNNYLKENIYNLLPYFSGKIKEIKFEYKTKIDLENIEKSINDYLSKNIDRDIILKRTSIGPHLDDFDIVIDDFSLSKFASRGETKSVVIGLKILEVNFIEKITNIKPILLIDDLLSELDENHKNLLLKNIEGKQSIITSINKIDEEHNIFI